MYFYKKVKRMTKAGTVLEVLSTILPWEYRAIFNTPLIGLQLCFASFQNPLWPNRSNSRPTTGLDDNNNNIHN